VAPGGAPPRADGVPEPPAETRLGEPLVSGARWYRLAA
jgi:hypothetical protein